MQGPRIRYNFILCFSFSSEARVGSGISFGEDSNLLCDLPNFPLATRARIFSAQIPATETEHLRCSYSLLIDLKRSEPL